MSATPNTSIKNTASRKFGTLTPMVDSSMTKLLMARFLDRAATMPSVMPTTMENAKAVRPSRMVTGAVLPMISTTLFPFLIRESPKSP